MTQWPEVLDGVTSALAGERARGRELLERAWGRTEPTDHAYRCVIAHYLADVQDDLGQEVA
ncbi:MAG: hypothetical protein ACRCZD_19000 [Phycicoccus sp.]